MIFKFWFKKEFNICNIFISFGNNYLLIAIFNINIYV